MTFDSRLLNGIEVLAAVVEAGSFVRAAESLGLTQSGVSRAIARLETRVGVRMFDRTARAVALTEEGRSFYQQVKPHLSSIEDAAIRAAGSAVPVRGRLRVNVDPFFARLVLAPHVGKFLAAHPELSLEILGRDRLGDLVADGFDAALRFGEPEPSSLVARRLLETRVLTCAAPAYLARRGRPAHPRELGDGRHECIHFVDPVIGRPFPWEFHRGRRKIRVAVSGRLTVNNVGTMLGACAAVTALPRSWRSGLKTFSTKANSSSSSPTGLASDFRSTCFISHGTCRQRSCERSWISSSVRSQTPECL
jgi:DNA-binding transcriptional LysR family regulator